jgi:hypothetical protein
MMETFAPMQPWFWILFFGAIIGYVYLSMQSITATIVAILLVFGIFGTTAIGGFFADVPIFSQFLYIITLVGLTALIGGLVMKRRF